MNMLTRKKKSQIAPVTWKANNKEKKSFKCRFNIYETNI